MKFKTIPYPQYENALPQEGRHILGQMNGENIIVYQAFNPYICEYALKNQKFGGPAYSFNRMSWIKPNFLWMMYRSGWASKPGQEQILAIELPLIHFKTIVNQAVYTAFNPAVHENQDAWQAQMKQSEVRLQWDPDHYPNGQKHNRKAIQLGMKGEILRLFGTEWLVAIHEVTEFAQQGGVFAESGKMSELVVMEETVIEL